LWITRAGEAGGLFMGESVLLTIGLVLLFILISAVFSGTELAVMSLRESQLDALAAGGSRGARVAAVARDPNRFLATIQIGITLCGFLSAAFGASSLAPALTPALTRIGLPAGIAGTVAFVLLTVIIVYLSLVIGELAPKRIAQQHASSIATIMAPPIDHVSRILLPVIWLLSKSTNGIIRLTGGDPTARQEGIEEEELRSIIAGQGSMTAEERHLLADVMTAADRTLAEAMTPRGLVAFLPAALTLQEAAEKIRDLPFSRYPVIGRNFDDILGFVHVRDVLQPPPGSDPSTTRVHAVKRPILLFPSTNRALSVMSTMRQAGAHIAVVVDEYTGTDGIVALEDLVEELVGDIRDEYDSPTVVHAAGIYDAGSTIEEFAKVTGEKLSDGPYETVGGYVLAALGREPALGDIVVLSDNARLTVTEVIDRRIVTVSLTRPIGLQATS
jgi:putative hemolysin